MMCAEGGEEGFDKEPFPSASQRINFDPFLYMGGIAWGSFSNDPAGDSIWQWQDAFPPPFI